jgi:hypothetical protein
MNEESVEAARVAREIWKTAYRDAFMRLAQILFEEDPVGISFGDNTDEYEAEAGTILPKLRECETVEQVQALLYSEFVRWFDVETAGPPDAYRGAAERIRTEMVFWTMP